jgi:acetyl esterase/lipase
VRVDLAEAIRALPHDISPETNAATSELFAPLHRTGEYGDIDIVYDLPYGLDDRHRLDLFLGNDGGDGALKPVLMFVHGGGYVGGDKRQTGSPYYENVGVWAARQGFIGVTMAYRLAPEHPWPAGPEDVAAAVAWLLNNIEAYGGNPQAIVLMGHSAGATHVASYVAMPECHAVPGGGVCGAIVISGPYDFQTYESERLDLYLADRRSDPSASPMRGMATTELPLLFAHAEFDPPGIRAQSEDLHAARAAYLGTDPDALYLAGHNHLSPILQLGADGAGETILSDRLVRFIRAAARTSGSRV